MRVDPINFVASFVANFVGDVNNKAGRAARFTRVVCMLYAASTGEAARSPNACPFSRRSCPPNLVDKAQDKARDKDEQEA
jgi:hypothetical protein